jgi:hypothetical protein
MAKLISEKQKNSFYEEKMVALTPGPNLIKGLGTYLSK